MKGISVNDLSSWEFRSDSSTLLRWNAAMNRPEWLLNSSPASKVANV
jgi:hypothetical protein